MRIPRIYQADKITVGSELELNPEAANHLSRVLRLPLGATLRLFNGEGGEYNAQISAVSKNKVTVAILAAVDLDLESPLDLHLGQGISRGEKMDYTVQKAVELGVTAITPLLTERCGVKLSAERWEKRVLHWRKIAIAACEQCGRNKIPDVYEPIELAVWVTKFESHRKFVLNPEAQQGLHHAAPSQEPTPISLLIGPEGGLSDQEINLARQQGFANLQLGPRILRTETAAVAALAVMQSHFGDLK